MKNLHNIRSAAAVAVALAFTALPASTQDRAIGAVYTMTNDATANAVLQYDRMPDGSLEFADSYATGGQGSGDGLGNQGGVVLSDDHRWLLVVNAGSDDVSVFAVRRNDLVLMDTEPTGGVRPISVAIHRRLIYVVHAGGGVGAVDSVTALRMDQHGRLTQLPGSEVGLSAPSVAPAQIAFSPDGRFVMVTEKATDTISVFPLTPSGYALPCIFNPAAGQTPFAFAFGRSGVVFVSEVFGGNPDAGAVSSYQLLRDGTLYTISASVPNTETAPCWLVAEKGGHYLFTTNTPDDSLSAYAVEPGGRLRLVDPGGRTGEPGAGSRPLDMDISDDGRHLYTLNIGNGTISTFRIEPGGGLALTAEVGGVLAGVNGLAAR